MKPKLQTLMTSLLYPAFLGTFLVSLSLQSEDLSTADRFLGIFLLVYFSVGFVESQAIAADDYKPEKFLADVLEIVLMSVAFVMLGVYDFYIGIDIPVLRRDSSAQLWAILCFVFTLPVAARLLPPTKLHGLYDGLCAAAVLVCFLASLCVMGAELSQVFLWVLLFAYLVTVAQDRARFQRDYDSAKPVDVRHRKRAVFGVIAGIVLGLVAFGVDVFCRASHRSAG